MSNSPLHPLTLELAAQMKGKPSRGLIHEQWERFLGIGVTPPPFRMTAEHPLIASTALQTEIDSHVQQLLPLIDAVAVNRLNNPALCHWPNITPPDVISADLAIVVDESSPSGWSLRWVEFQAFTSVISSMYALHHGYAELWPEIAAFSFGDKAIATGEWQAATRQWLAPEAAILVDRAPAQQVTFFDLAAASRLWGVPLIDAQDLDAIGSDAGYRDDKGRFKPVHRILNRLVMHELGNEREAFERKLGLTDVSWHSHPAWYYGLSKALMTQLKQAPGQQVVPLSCWRELGMPASSLVAKNVKSHGGHQVKLHVSDQELDSLTPAADWIVQPRYSSLPVLTASDGAPLYIELRCIVALPLNKPSWTCCQMVRISRGAKASSASYADAPGSGFTMLYRPEGLA